MKKEIALLVILLFLGCVAGDRQEIKTAAPETKAEAIVQNETRASDARVPTEANIQTPQEKTDAAKMPQERETFDDTHASQNEVRWSPLFTELRGCVEKHVTF